MDSVTLDDIAFEVDAEALLRRLHVEENSLADEARQLALRAQEIARPKALYKAAFVESRGDDHVVLDGLTLTSRVLQVNLEGVHRVFPYVATCGTELEAWSDALKDPVHRYWADTIKRMALRAAGRALEQHLVERYRPGRTSAMSPGSLEDWPIQQQRSVFELLGDPEKAIGVRLSDSFLMIPTKSVSGIRFPTEENFESCQLCPRQGCPGRRAPYDEGLYERRYRPEAS